MRRFLLLLLFLWVFHTNISWWSFTRIWGIEILLKSSGLFSVFSQILTMLWSVWSWFFLWSPLTPISLSRSWVLFLAHQQLLVSPLPSCSTAFLALARFKYMSLLLFSFLFALWSAGTSKSTWGQMVSSMIYLIVN